MRKKVFGIIAVIAAGMMLIVSVAACGSQKQETTTTTAETTKASETTTEKESTTAKAEDTTTQAADAPAADNSSAQNDTPAVINDVDRATRELALERAGAGSVVISSEEKEGTIGGYTGTYYRIGVRDASGNVIYYNGKADFVYTDAEVEELNKGYDSPAVDEEPAIINDVERATRELALQMAGEGAVVISSEEKEGTIGGYTGTYYRIGVRDASGNVTYYNGKADFVYTDEEVEELNKEYGN